MTTYHLAAAAARSRLRVGRGTALTRFVQITIESGCRTSFRPDSQSPWSEEVDGRTDDESQLSPQLRILLKGNPFANLFFCFRRSSPLIPEEGTMPGALC